MRRSFFLNCHEPTNRILFGRGRRRAARLGLRQGAGYRRILAHARALRLRDAPVVVLAELALGLSLLLGFRLRRTGCLATLFLAGVTAVFAYGVLCRGVGDCGCFGAESPLNGPPAAAFLRNAALLVLTGAVWLGGSDDASCGPAVRRTFLAAMSAGAFLCGWSFRTAGCTTNRPQRRSPKLRSRGW